MTPKNGELSVGGFALGLCLFFGTVEKAIGSVIFLQKWPSPKITRGVKKQGGKEEGTGLVVPHLPFCTLKNLCKFTARWWSTRLCRTPWTARKLMVKITPNFIDYKLRAACLEVHFLKKDGCHVKLDTGSSTTNITISWHVLLTCFYVNKTMTYEPFSNYWKTNGGGLKSNLFQNRYRHKFSICFPTTFEILNSFFSWFLLSKWV